FLAALIVENDLERRLTLGPFIEGAVEKIERAELLAAGNAGDRLGILLPTVGIALPKEHHRAWNFHGPARQGLPAARHDGPRMLSRFVEVSRLQLAEFRQIQRRR